MKPLLRFTEEVEDAIADRRPVVALESTLVAHGLPPDQRATVARRLEAVIRQEGATPATIAVMDREMVVGLSDEALARVIEGGAVKASLRDLPIALAQGGTWATTVASTMAVAARAGIRLFATGGIGGVHRGASASFDESADLTALARYRVAVVCAGAKAVLDLSKTLERLETLGVPVVGWQTSELPSFYSATSGLPLVATVRTEAEAAAIIELQLDGLKGGGVLFVQAPPSEVALEHDRVEALIRETVARAESAGIRGRELTPYLLETIRQASGGDSVKTNVALAEANARLAARLAVADVAHARTTEDDV